MEKFRKLGLSEEVLKVLKQLNFKEPTEIQEKAISLAIAGKDIIGGSATGSGKTLVFASSIIENTKPNFGIQALILTPTRELAEQVAKSIYDFGEYKDLNVLAIYGGVSIGPQIRQLTSTEIVVGTPGRILDHIKRGTLNLKHVKILVLDEVDRMFDMGFHKDVETIIRECPKQRQTMMFSATISMDIDYLAKKYTKDPVEISVESYVDASKLTQFYYDVSDNEKFSLLVTLLKKESAGLVMIFCNTRRNVDFVANNLERAGINAKAIHGGIDQKKRIRLLEEFHAKGLGILVCTDVAARGLDIKGVTHVYNYDVSKDSKDYIHRIGRTARAGEQGKAITILASKDYENFRNVTRDASLTITKIELPLINFIRVQSNFNKRRGGFSRGPRREGPRSSNQRRSSNFRGSRSSGQYSNPRGSNFRSSESSRNSSRYSNSRRSNSRSSNNRNWR